jgi:hypothetical protein
MSARAGIREHRMARSTWPWRHVWLGMVLALACSGALAADAASTVILLVDSARVERELKVLERLSETHRAALKKAPNAQQREGLDLALELQRSEVLGALSEVVTEIAMARAADLVIEPSVARRLELGKLADVTPEVIAALDTRYADLKLESLP